MAFIVEALEKEFSVFSDQGRVRLACNDLVNLVVKFQRPRTELVDLHSLNVE